MLNKVKKYKIPLVCLCISLWALVPRYQVFSDPTLVGDEIYQYIMLVDVVKPFRMLTQYGDFSSFPGDYIITYPFLKIFGPTSWGIRVPYIVLHMFLFYFTYLVCKNYFKTIFGYVVTFGILCLNTTLIVHSFEFRPYAVLPTLAIVSFYVADLVINKEIELGFPKKFFIVFFYLFTFVYHAHSLFFISIPILYFTLDKLNRKSFTKIWNNNFKLYSIIILIGGGIWLWYSIGTYINIQNDNFTVIKKLDTFQFIPNPSISLIGFLKGIFGNLIGNKKLYFYCLNKAEPTATILSELNK